MRRGVPQAHQVVAIDDDHLAAACHEGAVRLADCQHAKDSDAGQGAPDFRARRGRLHAVTKQQIS